MAKLKKEHKAKLKAFAVEQDDEQKTIKAQEMMESLEGLLTESLLYAVMQATKNGDIDVLLTALPEEEEVAEEVKEESIVEEPKEEPIVEETPYEPPVVEAPTLTEAEVEEAVEAAEATATEEEKTTGFWRRFANFFTGLFVSKKVT